MALCTHSESMCVVCGVCCVVCACVTGSVLLSFDLVCLRLADLQSSTAGQHCEIGSLGSDTCTHTISGVILFGRVPPVDARRASMRFLAACATSVFTTLPRFCSSIRFLTCERCM